MGVFMAAGVFAFVGFIGLSVDAIRGYLVQSRLSSALDAAGLAGARVMFSPTRDADILMYFNANFPAGYLGATVTGPTFTVDANNEVINLTAEATIDTTLMQVLGFKTLTVSAAAEITRQTELLDVVIAMDMSTSMTYYVNGTSGAPVGQRRIDYARNAAQELVDILYGTDGLAPLLNIGLVPWSGKVNVTLNGTTFNPALTQTVPVPAFTNPITGLSQSSVYQINNSPVPMLIKPGAAEPFTDTNGNGVRNSGEPYTDTNGNGQYDTAYTWPGCVFARYIHDGAANDADLEIGPMIGVGGKDWPAWDPIDRRGEPISGGCSFCLACPTQGITPLQNAKSVIDAAVAGLTSPNGTTEIIGGLAWAWRVLVPGAPFTEADPNPQGRRTQAIVLLTDGEYFGYYGDAYDRQFGTGTSAGGPMPGTKGYGRLKQLADKIKAAGVVIYVIQFAEDSIDLETKLKQVASGPDAPFYHNAPNQTDLQNAFREVANDLSQLRLSM